MARPTFRAAAVTVRVPASSANLGPGFDTCGLALGLHDHVRVRVVDSGLTVDIAGEGAESLKRTERNLVVTALRAAFDSIGGQPRGLVLECANRVPQSRGLGSSAAAVVAGVLAARELVTAELDDDWALQVACEVEGHPDNVAACLLGGFTVAWTEPDGHVRATALPVSPELHPVLFVPSGATQSTKASRATLPEQVSLGDAAFTSGRSALLSTALAGRSDLLMAATEDRLHQPVRLANQPRGGALLARLRSAGHAAVLSGSGPTVLALCPTVEQAQAAAALVTRGFEALALPVDHDGATLE
jgi:homoserine kinase